MSVQTSNRVKPHRRQKRDYIFMSAYLYKTKRMNKYIALKENLCMLEELYSTDDTEQEFKLQNHYFQFEKC